MTASTNAWFLLQSMLGGTGVVSGPSGAIQPEEAPAWLWGQGTPAAIVPFTTVNKGSVYSEVNTTDDNPNLWMKIDEGGDAADWVLMSNTGIVEIQGLLIDISAAASEQVIFHAVTACEILEAGVIYEEATGTTGAAEGDITIGTTTGGNELVEATPYAISKASGAYAALTLVTGALAAGDSIFISHDQAASAAGEVRPLLKIRVEA